MIKCVKFGSIRLQVAMLALIISLVSCSKRDKLSDAYGNFEAIQVTVSAESSGQILALNLQEGDMLDSGAMVGLIDTTDLHLRKLQLVAQKNASKVKLENIASQVEVQNQQKANLLVDKTRIEKLVKDNAATRKQLDDVNGALDLVDKQVQMIKTQNAAVSSELEVLNRQVAQVDESLRKCYLVNPVKGTVLTKFSLAGELAMPGKALYKIANLDTMELKVYVSGDMLPSIKHGQQAEVLIDAGKTANRKLSGRVSWISPKAEFTPKIIQTKEERVDLVYAIKLRVANDGSLKIAMPAEVNFIEK